MKHALWSMLLVLAGAAQAQDVRDAPGLQAASLAANCSACHGTQGRAVAGSAVPGLAGQPASAIVEQMKAFKSGARTATVMHQIAKGYNEAQIDQLAAYFAAQKK
ncbi:MAG TPA: c-type cytochrome [Albitalea sp.]|nr:c-type cytochrome [Albitalea sp.]